ncbi:MAG: hypothetical protein AAB432_02805 [Patescibacteria group bacterium]
MENNILAKRIIKFIKTKKSLFWEKERQSRMLKLFHECARRVPAYKHFLKKNHISVSKIKAFGDLEMVPPIDKNNYLKNYPLKDLCWDGTLKKPLTLTATSGSTGESFYFPRSQALDWQSSIIHEIFLENGFRKTGGPTLVIICFGMGVWIGGLITYEAFNIAINRGEYPVSILTPGINKPEIFKALRLAAENFSQTILVGYPPFIKDVIDEAGELGINLRRLHLRVLFAAEAFTESFRNYVAGQAAIQNPYLDTSNIYGTADLGTMAYETPTSILTRRLADQNQKIWRDIFSSIGKMPTLTQYNPFFVNFEAPRGNILITGDNAIPLVRYAVGDRGGVLSFSELADIFKANGKNLMKEAKKLDLEKYLSELPFVYVYERADLSATLYGINIPIQPIREALLWRDLSKYLTGKFVLMTKFDKNQNQYLEINLELRQGKKPNQILKEKTLLTITRKLAKASSEFHELSNHLGKRVLPKLVFFEHEHHLYFKPGIKQKWIKK